MVNFSYSLLRSDLALGVAPLLVAAAAAASLGAGAAVRLARPSLRRPRCQLGERGTSDLEFALALPVFLGSVLTVVQLALMINAHLIVDYAAFCAARSAAVWLPQDMDGEPPLAIGPMGQSAKHARIHRAATLAVLPISPRLSRFRFGLGSPPAARDLDSSALAGLVNAADTTRQVTIAPLRLAATAADKWAYARAFTNVDLQQRSGRTAASSEDLETVTARVTHKFEMATPLAGALLGSMLGERYVPLVGGYYVPITAAYTLMVSPS